MSGILGGLIASFPTPVTSSFESIATTTLGSDTSSITMSSIPSTYASIQFRILMRNTGGGGCDLNLRANSDTGNNYSYHYLEGQGASVSASGGSTSDRIYMNGGIITGTTSVWSAVIIDVHDYASTTKYKTFRVLGGFDRNGGGNINLVSGLWQSTSAMNSMTLFNNAGYNWNAGTIVSLYGIKGA